MKKILYTLLVVVALFAVAVHAQTPITKWGETTQGRFWTIMNDINTPAGNGSISGPAINGGGQASIRGGFDQEMLIKSDEALIVQGKLQLVGTLGGESSYNPLRFALTYNADDTLKNALTDSAYWVRGPGFGYNWCPRTGSGLVANGAWGSGTVGVVNNGNWHSTNSNGGKALATILQAPRNAQMKPGTYNWAISVQQVNDTTNEIRWYLIEENNKYWFGGVVTGPAVTNKLTGVSFNVNTGDWTALNVIAAEVDYDAPITIPEAPWEAYYVDQWGRTSQGTAWPILNNSETLVGDASISGPNPIPGWATVRGEFGQDLPLKTDKFLVVTGQMELVGATGGENTYTPLRYALTYHANDTLKNALTDSAVWVRTTGWGYGFHPRSGSGTMSNGNGGQGTLWSINNGSWASTYSNNGKPLAAINQTPRNAELIPGIYDFAIAVRSINDTTNEIRWYLMEENKEYLFAGTDIDTATTKKFNGISFGVNTGGWTSFNILGAEVDYVNDVVVPKLFNIAIDGEKDDFYTKLESPEDGYLQLQYFHGNNNGYAKDNNDHSAKVWTAWDEEWFYMYTEVTDDSVSATSANSYQNDVLELKIDPQPTDSTQAGGSVFAPTLTILKAPGNDSLNIITAANKQYVRKVTNYGYVLELATKWTAMTIGGETITPEVGNVFGMGINFHDNDGNTATPRESSLQWAAVMRDEVWNTPKYMGRVFFLDDNKLEWDPTNNMTGVENKLLYDGTPVGVDDVVSKLPKEYSLSQNYPNPFNPTTTIDFALPKAGNVSLVVYDILGKVITTLVDGEMTAGYHRINFNANNLSSGIYFYAIKTGDFVNVKKLILLK